MASRPCKLCLAITFLWYCTVLTYRNMGPWFMKIKTVNSYLPQVAWKVLRSILREAAYTNLRVLLSIQHFTP